MATGYLVLTLVAAIVGWSAPADLAPGDWTAATDLPANGKASYYNPGVMEIVWQNRLNFGTVKACPDCVGAVAMLRHGDVGRKVWIEYKQEVLGPFMVVDCAGVNHYDKLIEIGEVVELPYWLAVRWKMAGRIHVTVHDKPPAGVASIKGPAQPVKAGPGR